MKNIEGGLEFVEQLVYAKTGKSLTGIQKAVLQESWDGQRKTYNQIAEEFQYSASYIKQTVAPQLWRLLSEVLGEKVNKTNISSVVERRQANQSSIRCQKLIERLRKRLEPYYSWQVQLNGTQKIVDASGTKLTTATHQKPINLEIPKGYVPLNSAFYIERVPNEHRCYQEIINPGSLIQIKAPRQMGKTSFMVRILAYASILGYQTVSLNLLQADKKILTDINKLLRWICANITHKLKLKNRLDDYWDEDLGSKANCTIYLQEYLLLQIEHPLVLAFDEVNQIFDYSEIAQDFLSLLSSWHEEAKDNDIWKKLRIIVSNSTEIYLPLTIHKSPFTVGLSVQLRSFSWEQVQDLAQRHQLNISIGDLAELMWLLGGHPYLLRVAFYHLAHQDLTWEKLTKTAASDTGIYSEYLHQHLWCLQQHPELATAFEQVLKAKAPIELEQVQAFKLHSMGLVNMQNNQVMISCDLYQQYFGK
ncbi:AAA-like domain-containing protein [Calothrix sp. FACHB-1219]|uniref:AAA-like domain-containing protein n=1 Tax=unclassified Calothrix TaxID=2619626 RepID=UPI001684EE4E|nr:MULTISPECIES: AAA-like domain-containing protein [unclassified Calothrix]MBD2205224.1 AAA-like domain-containing protein [Calothrix sp. FACHB-168]MBD2216630.1 AAA-like domain-containing protein [Calothrix sp. FACHB-1219]